MRLLKDPWAQVFGAVALFAGLLCLAPSFHLPAFPGFGGEEAPAAAPSPAPAAPAASAASAVTATPSFNRPKDGVAFVVDPAGGQEADAKTLGEAIDMAPAGSTILLRRGLHKASVVVDKALKIHGEGKLGETLLVGVSGPALTAASEGVVVKNLTVVSAKTPTASAILVRRDAALEFAESAADGTDALAAAVVEGRLLSLGSDYSSGKTVLIARAGGVAVVAAGVVQNATTLVITDGQGARVQFDETTFRNAEYMGEPGPGTKIGFTGGRFDEVKWPCNEKGGGTCDMTMRVTKP